MEIFSMTEISIPVIQMVLLLLLSTGALFFGKLKLALLINYLFTLYCGATGSTGISWLAQDLSI